MDYALLIVLLAIAAVCWLRDQARRKSPESLDAAGAEPISDEALARLESAFERRLASESDLPDAIRGREAFIHRQLMRPWFSALAAAHRYDATGRQLRRDWCDYLELLPRAATARFLALEAQVEERMTAHESEAALTSRRIQMIQDAFAAAVGAEAIESLKQVRRRHADAFDRSGTLPMAPEGYRYFPVSIHPHVEQCEPISTAHAPREA